MTWKNVFFMIEFKQVVFPLSYYFKVRSFYSKASVSTRCMEIVQLLLGVIKFCYLGRLISYGSSLACS